MVTYEVIQLLKPAIYAKFELMLKPGAAQFHCWLTNEKISVSANKPNSLVLIPMQS